MDTDPSKFRNKYIDTQYSSPKIGLIWSMDKLRAMATFVAIVDRGSLTAAAEALGSSLPAVVRLLATLENALGVRLLNRTTRRTTLTEEGRDYLERCRRVLAEIEEAEAAISVQQQHPSGKLGITAPVLFGRLHVAPLVTEFLTHHTRVKAELLLLDRIVDLIDEGLDLAVRIGELPDSSLVAINCGQTRRVVCASPEYLRRTGIPETPADLRQHRCVGFIGLSRGQEWEFKQGRRPLRVPVDGPLVANHGDIALDACRRGLGCGIFLHYQVRDALAAGHLRLLLDAYEPPPLPINVVYPHSRLLPLRVRVFLDWFVPQLRLRLTQ
jgi:DNA-binding transcriptional LysR family regulator